MFEMESIMSEDEEPIIGESSQVVSEDDSFKSTEENELHENNNKEKGDESSGQESSKISSLDTKTVENHDHEEVSNEVVENHHDEQASNEDDNTDRDEITKEIESEENQEPDEVEVNGHLDDNEEENDGEEQAIDNNITLTSNQDLEDDEVEEEADPMAIGNEDDLANEDKSVEVDADNENNVSILPSSDASNDEITIVPTQDETEGNATKNGEILNQSDENIIQDVEMRSVSPEDKPDDVGEPEKMDCETTKESTETVENKQIEDKKDDVDSDDSDVIIEEQPNDSNKSQSTKTFTPMNDSKTSKIEEDLAQLDLEMECSDEPLEPEQQTKAKNLRINFENMLKDVAKLKKQTRILSSKRPGTQLLGIGTKNSQVSLVRPSVSSLSSPQAQQQLRFVQQNQIRPGQPVTFSVAPRINTRNAVTTAQIANPGGFNQVIRTNAGVAPFQQIPSLIYDSNSGLLLMPTVTNAMSMSGLRLPISSQSNSIMTTAPITPQLQGGVNIGGGVRPRFAYSGPAQQAANRRVTPQNTTMMNSLTRPPISFPSTFNSPRIIPNSSQARPIHPNRPAMTQQVTSRPPIIPLMQNKNPPPRPEVRQNKPAQPPVQEKPKSATNGSGDDNTKTFPSLVVNVKPCLLDKPSKAEFQKARADLDARVKALLVYSPSKFTEWLMQRGLLRLEHKCHIHSTAENIPVSYKLGMYSDGTKQPFSGGYVWIASCCPDKQISVFQGSIFEASVYPPGTLFKLIYHWSCQTTAANVLQWVKVTSYYLKNFYTLLRSACVAALHELGPEMGGPKKYVEVGIITLGTSMPNQSSGSKQVKVEILGVFDPSTKAIRLKVVNPQAPPANSNAAHNRVLQILWPLRHWVDKESTILIDMGIEKSLILEMGFTNVIQCKNGVSPKAGAPTNVNVMNYLKHVVPKMFQNTLCVLSKSLIQQFLDELCWRELWGQTPATTHDNMINHLVQMTKWDTGEPLITRLNKISLNPFGEWSYSRNRTGIEMLPDSISGLNQMPPLTMQQSSDLSSSMRSLAKGVVGNTGASKPSPLQTQVPTINGLFTTGTTNATNNNKRKPTDPAQLMKEQLDDFNRALRTQPRTLLLYSYYYGESTPEDLVPPSGLFPQNLKCPLCSKQFLQNQEVVRHIFMHVQSMGIRSSQRDSMCDYCLKEVGITGSLSSHVNEAHKMLSTAFGCLICQEKFNNEKNLILHMWENHCKQDMPYRCELCDYRNSFHYEVVNHFMKEHSGFDSVLCPYCLKVLPAKSLPCMKQIVVHMQNHTIKKGKKCPHCSLVFTCDGDYRHHLNIGAHQEDDSDTTGRIITVHQNEDDDIKMPTPPERKVTKLLLPPPPKKSKTEEPVKKTTLNVYKPALRVGDGGATQIEDFRTKYVLPLLELPECLECGKKMDSAGHFPAFISCVKCRFSTSCRTTMDLHLTEVHPPDTETNNPNPGTVAAEIKLKPSLKVKHPDPLSINISCSCGFKTKRPVQAARHLALCDKMTGFADTEFPTEDFISSNDGKIKTTRRPSFLNQLGLTRN